MIIVLLKASLFMSVTVAVLIVLAHLFRRPDMACWRYICWIAVIFGLLIPFRPTLFTYSEPDAVIQMRRAVMLPRELERTLDMPQLAESYTVSTPSTDNAVSNIQSPTAEVLQETVETVEKVEAAPKKSKKIDVGFLIGIGWATGFMAFALLFMMRHVRFIRLVKRWGRPVTDTQLLNILEDVRKAVGLKRKVKLYTFPVTDTPILTGLFKPVILLPIAQAENYGSNMKLMLAHELIHCKRGDIWVRMLLLMAWAIHWFNPAMFLLNRYMSADCEISCDQAVLRYMGMENRACYGKAVLDVARSTGKRKYIISPAFSTEAQNLKKRLASIIEPRAMKRRWVVLCSLLLVISTTSSMLLTGCGVNSKKDAIPDAKVDLTPTDELVIYLPQSLEFGAQYFIALRDFKSMYPNVNVIVERRGDTIEQYQTVVSTDLMAGSGPDIIFTDYFTSDLYKVMDTGLFLNLNSVIAADSDFSMDDYNTAVMSAGYYKGGQYIIPTTYIFPSMLSDKNNLDRIGLALTNATDTTALLNEIYRCLPNIHENPEFIALMLSANRLYTDFGNVGTGFLYMSGIKLIDEATKEILPDENAFRDFCLAYKNAWGNEHYRENGLSLSVNIPTMRFYEALSSGAALLEEYRGGVDSAIIQWIMSKDNGGTPTWVMLRNTDGGMSAIVDTAVGINSSSTNQLNAWNYIKILLSEPVQEITNNGLMSGWKQIPVDKATFNKVVEKRTVSDFMCGMADLSGSYLYTAPALTAEDAAAVKMIHTEVTHSTLKNPMLYNFFELCMTPYFNDEKSLDDCITDLKNQLAIYASE